MILKTKPMFLASALVAGMVMALVAQTHVQSDATSVQPLNPAPAVDAGDPINETPESWFVELSSPPAADGTSLTTLRNEKDAFRAAARAAGLRYTERYAFDKLWNGLSVRISSSQLAALARTSGVKALYPVQPLSIPDPIDPELGADMFTALALTGADIAQNTLGLTGAGIRVGIIDTGIDYDHPDFGGSGISGSTPFPTSRVVVGYDFVGDNYDASGTPAQQVPAPDPNPDDCNGHGTHVAGIVGANGQIKGVAPNVVFGAYKVFGCAGTTDADVLIAAMEQALADGMQVVNISIGARWGWPQYPYAQAADRLVNKGVVVVCSIGNNFGPFNADAPGVASKVIGVGSFQNTYSNSPYFTVSPDNRVNTYSPGFGAVAAVPSSGSFPMARTGTVTSVADACSPLPAGSLTGKVALIRRGTCSFYQKAMNAQNAGAIGVVLYNNVAGALTPNVTPPTTSDPRVSIPVVGSTAADGAVINSRLASGPVALTWTDQFISTPISSEPILAYPNTWGPSPDLILKPDIGAPGAQIRSTVPIEQGSTGSMSGTSMASPHVAGAVALLLEARPHTSSQAVRTILQNSADPKLSTPYIPARGLAEVFGQGAGLLDIPGAVLSTTKIEPGKLSLGESEFGPVTRSLTIENNDPAAVTYDLSHAPAASISFAGGSVGYYYGTTPAAVTFSSPSVAVPAGGTAMVDVTISPNAALPDLSLYGGYIVFTPQDGGAVYRVPYFGLKGDYQSIQVLVPRSSNYPRMGRQLPSGSFTLLPVGDGGIWTLENDQNMPFVLAAFNHQSRRLRLEIFDANTSRAWHRALELEYLTPSLGFFALGWDGTTVNGRRLNTVPNGQYVIVMSVLKALGDESNPAHWETWTSPVITIARP